ncbi:MAG: hypothetical protein QG635_1813 [Bacteroidota bacterium]|nr:hypothetical protein [Bacteroidota bacterium]
MSCPIISINKRLALLAFVLGLIALILGDPSRATRATIDTKEIAGKISSADSKIKVEVLADWIIQGKADFTIIDLSDEKSYNNYHIPGSLNLQPSELQSGRLMRNSKILLYSDDNIKTAQSWLLLKAMKYPSVYFVDGGMESWKSKILFPAIPDSINPEDIAKYLRMKEMCSFFGGAPQMSGNAGSEKPKFEMSKITAPVQSSIPKKGKPKREGC